jgi:Holliday junction resolvase
MSNVHKGRRFEYEIQHLFEDAGFSVMRGAGSKGALLEEKVDLICTKETSENEFTVFLTIVGVQCKAKRIT